MTFKKAFVGLVTLLLAMSQGAASADWKSKAARRTVGGGAKAGMENAAKDAAMDAALGAVGPDRPESGDIGRGKRDVGATIGSAAGEGLEAAMTAADVASSIA